MEGIRRQLWEHERRLGELSERIGRLEVWRDNQRTREAHTPVWASLVWSVLGTLVTVLTTLFVAGVFA